MSPTPRTDESRRTDNGETGPLLDKMEVLETELAAAKGECERLKFATEGHLLKTIQQQAELAAAKAECNRLYESSPTALDALTAELTRLRAEVSEARRAWLGDDYGHLPLIEALEKFRSDSDAESDRADVLYQRACEVEHKLRAEVELWEAKCHELIAPHYIIDPCLRAAKFREALAFHTVIRKPKKEDAK